MSEKLEAPVRRRRAAAETREHVLAVAADLFYWQGTHSVGVDTVAATAEVAPATLYRLFGSKDDLVAAYVQRAAARYREWFAEAVGAAGAGSGPREKVLAVFDALAVQVRPEVCRGCPFLLTLCEWPGPGQPAHEEAVAVKAWVRDRFAELARELVAGTSGADPDALADQLVLVMEGVYASVQALGADGPASQARPLVEALLP